MAKTATIVGAGPGGLATAMLLAKAGLRVRVLERMPHVGGRTSHLTEDGFTFDLGPTFFLYPRILQEIFSACGYDLRREIELIPLDPQYRLVFGEGGELLATPNRQLMEQRVAALSPADAGGFGRFMDDNRRKLKLFEPCLESPASSLRDMMGTHLLRALPALRPWRTLDRDLSRHFVDPRIRLAFTFQSKYLGMSPFQCPSLFSILSFLEYEYGVFHPVGGCGAVSQTMARLAEEMGVEILLDEPVEEILFRGRKAVGVRTPRDQYETDVLVINSDFARTMTRLVPDALRRRWTDAKIARKKFSCSTYMLYLGIEGRYDDLSHHTIYLSRDYVRNLDDIQRRFVLSEDPSLYMQNACVTDPALAPPGMSTLYVLAPVPHQHPNIDWSQSRAAFRETVLDQLAKLGLGDIRDRIRYERIVTPADWDQQYEIHRGATFNLSHSLSQMLYLRPRNRFEDLQGVYLVGGGTHPGSGLPVIFSSAKITTRLLLEDLGLGADFLDRALAPPVSVVPQAPAAVEVG